MELKAALHYYDCRPCLWKLNLLYGTMKQAINGKQLGTFLKEKIFHCRWYSVVSTTFPGDCKQFKFLSNNGVMKIT